MTKPPKYWHKAKKILSKRDPVLREIIRKIVDNCHTKTNIINAVLFETLRPLTHSTIIN